MTTEMLELARANAAKTGAGNVEFIEGTIEAIPLPDASIDVGISNCVINLSTDKSAVFAEMYRVLVPGGRARKSSEDTRALTGALTIPTSSGRAPRGRAPLHTYHRGGQHPHELPGRVAEVPAGEVWVHCASGYRASIAASLIDASGRTATRESMLEGIRYLGTGLP